MICRGVIPASSPMTPSTQATLVEHLLAHPNDDDAWAVYGDLLSAEGDPRGEIIALSLSVEPDAEAHVAHLIKKHEPLWLEERARRARREYEYGFLREFVCAGSRSRAGLPMLYTLLRSSAARFLRTLKLGFDNVSFRSIVDQIAAHPPRGLRSLSIEVFSDIAPDDDPHPLLSSLPHLQSLFLDTSDGTLALSHDKLETLWVMEHSPCFDQQLGQAVLPKLTSLEIASMTDAPFEVRTFAPMLQHARSLEKLIIHNLTDVAALIDALLSANMLCRLKELDIAHGDLDDKGAQLLLDNPNRARQVAYINITGNNVSDEMFVTLAQASIRVMG